MISRLFQISLLLLCALIGTPALDVASQPASLRPPSTGGIAALDRALLELTKNRRILVVAAHPDDENTTLLTLEALREGGEAAYLSLTRGDGGQNLIGPELGEALGVIRSQELVSARTIDGTRQFFTRAYDFGYTKEMSEALERWGEDVLLEDAVRIIRRFKPQVVVSIFPPDPRAGHGQHQAAGKVAPQAFDLAGDPEAFPELAEEGLAPWQPDAFFLTTWRVMELTTHLLDAGGLDPHLGRTLHQISMESRSQHRSQDMGMLQEIGPRQIPLAWLKGSVGQTEAGDEHETSLFKGISTDVASIAGLLENEAAATTLRTRLERVGAAASRLREELSPARLADAVEPLTEILSDLRQASETTARLESSSPRARQARELIEEKIDLAQEALLVAAGIVLDARADKETTVARGALEVETRIWNSGPLEVAQPRVELSSPADWIETTAVELPPEAAGRLAPGQLAQAKAQLTLSELASPTLPYFLERPREGDLYDWSRVYPKDRGEPFGPPPLIAGFSVEVEGTEVWVQREVTHRYRDQAFGEVRRPIRLLPDLEVSVEPELIVWPAGDRQTRPLTVTLDSHAAGPLRGSLHLVTGTGWQAPTPLPFEIDRAQGPQTFTVELPPPPAGDTGRREVAVQARVGGRVYDRSYPVIDYPHIRPTPLRSPARVQVTAADLKLPALGRVGYVRGASDRVPEQLQRIGVPLELLSPADLVAGDLAAYDVIVVGSRAYETVPALGAANPRLLAYVAQGGHLVVQYQQYQFVGGGYAPYELSIGRPHGRVTDETAEMRPLRADHPVFQNPNVLGPADWEGWVQERGLYFAETWDDAFQPLLSTNDPGKPALEGGLLAADYGQGTYVYTGLAFFRQLPAGVPGAYRLFANLLAYRGP